MLHGHWSHPQKWPLGAPALKLRSGCEIFGVCYTCITERENGEKVTMIEKTLDNKTYYELTDDECRKLLALGDEAMTNTYPESGNGYAVAVMTRAGNIYTGVSYKSDTATLT